MNYPHGCLIGDHRNSLTTHNSTLKQYDAREAVKAPSGFFGASGHLVDRVMNPKTALGLWDAMDLFVLVAKIGTAVSAVNGLLALLN